MKNILFLWVLILTSANVISQTNYYVSPAGNDNNAGTSEFSAWQTIQMAANILESGDTVHIMEGTYNETVIMNNSGNSSGYITYRNYKNDNVIFTKDLTISKDYITVEGIELSGCSMIINGSYDRVMGNYVHNSGVCGLFIHGSYNLIRGNKIANNGSSWCNQISTAWTNGAPEAHHIVFEYNEVSDEEGQGEDFMQYLNHDFIARGNYFHHLGNNGRHNDIYQSGGGEYNIWMINNRFENLYAIQYFMTGEGDHDHIWRNNLFWGTIGWGFNGMPEGMRVINNTFSLTGPSGGDNGNWGVGGVGMAFNNIFSPPGSDGHHGVQVDYNCVYPSPCCSDQGSNDLWNTDPMFTDTSVHDFQLKYNSPCIDAGTYPTATEGDGSGTEIRVADSRIFIDGFGITEGDKIQLEGQSDVAQILHIDYASNVLTLDIPLSWNNGTGVSIPFNGNAPDIGAFEFEDPLSGKYILSEKIDFTIYPNLASDNITIVLNSFNINQTVHILNLMGQVVKTQDITNVSKINISNLSAGIYFIQLEKSPFLTKKFIKQ